MCPRGIALAVLLSLTGVAPALAADTRWFTTASVNYSIGDYGTGEDTELLYIPFTLGVTPIEPLTLSLTLPYVRQTTQTVVTTGGGVAVRRENARRVKTEPRAVTRTEDGMGDILLKGEYVLLKEQPLIPEIAGSLKIKFPTADEDKGLGTGEFDETIGVGFSKTFLERLAAYLSLGYTFVGSPPGTELDDSFSWSIGAAYSVAPPVAFFAFLDGATAIAPGQEDPLELRVGAEYKLNHAVKLTGSVGVGLSDGSPDFGVSVGLGIRF